jgi:ABC-type multidrug transport system ATPase subunit
VSDGVLLDVRSLDVRRGRRTVLTGVALALRAGEVAHVTGANGSGKTSLLRAVAGLAPAPRGTVRRGAACAFVPEKVLLVPALRCGEWLGAMRRLRGEPPVDWPLAVAAAGLDPDVLHRRSSALSKGTIQRLALLDALHASTPTLLLDEPFSGLDTDARTWLATALHARTATGAAVLLTDPSGATGERLAPTLVLRLEGGRCVAEAGAVAGTGARAPSAGGRAGGAGDAGAARVSFSGDASPHAAVASLRLVASHGDGRRCDEQVARADIDDRLRALLDGGWHIEQVAP